MFTSFTSFPSFLACTYVNHMHLLIPHKRALSYGMYLIMHVVKRKRQYFSAFQISGKER